MASAKEIPPGGEGKIDITFKTGAGSGGKREKHIDVTTNDPDQKSINLTISTEVVVAIGISPNRVSFNQVKKGVEHIRYASIDGEDKDKTKITGAESTNPNIKVEINPKGFEDDRYRQIKVILMPAILVGRFFEKVTIHTDHKDMKDIQFDVMGDVTGDVAIIPNQLHFGLFQKGKQVERVILLKAAENVNFKVLDIKSTIPEVTTSIETVEAGRQYRVHAQLKDGFAGDSLKGNLKITTDLKEDSIIQIDILGRLLPPSLQQQQPQNVQPFLKDGKTPQPAQPQMPPIVQPSGGPPPVLKDGQSPTAPPVAAPR